ncbi:MAG: GNAT family N-acetyltransferase [Bauldia sp.]|nr:GNAT family N-acetyltransferase [Bauldia sp.]
MPSIARAISPVPPDMWDEVYGADGHALPTQSRMWRNALLAGGRFRDVSRAYEFTDGRRMVLPLFRRGPLAQLWSGRRSPPPAWGFGGLISATPAEPRHVRLVLDDLRRQRGTFVRIRPNPLDAPVWRAAMPTGWEGLSRNAHVLDLSGGMDTVWRHRFRQGCRANIRRAERAGLDIECGTSEELVTAFHRLLQQSLERWAHKQHEPAALARWRGRRRDPLEKLRSMVVDSGGLARVWLARKDGEPVAAILVIKDHQAHYTRGVMDEEAAGDTHANYLLQFLAIKDACESGCRHYHMGETGDSESLAFFKSRFGAEAVPYAEYRFQRIPVASAGDQVRWLVKRAIGFRDA